MVKHDFRGSKMLQLELLRPETRAPVPSGNSRRHYRGNERIEASQFYYVPHTGVFPE